MSCRTGHSLWLINFFLFLLCGFLVGYVAIISAKVDYMQRVSNDLYSHEAISWTGAYELDRLTRNKIEPSEIEKWSVDQIKQYQSLVQPGEMLFMDVAANTRAVYFSDQQMPVPIVSGRFFTRGDFEDGLPRAVLGRNYLDGLIEEHGKKYYQFDQFKFEVIGVLGMASNSMLDAMILLNMNAVPGMLSPGHVWTLDSFRSASVSADRLDKLTGISRIKRESSGIDRVVSGKVNMRMSRSLLVSLLFALLLASYYLIAKSENTVHVLRLLGHSPARIVYHLTFNFCLLILTGIAMGLAAAYALFSEPYFQLETSFKLIAAIILINLLAYFAMSALLVRQNLATALKSW